MIRRAALAFVLGAALFAVGVRAETAYVTDELVLNVYAELNQQGQRLATLHSGASLETLSTNGEYTQVRLTDGTTGWVKTSYLTTQVPATERVKQLEEELDRNRSTTPGLAEAAAKSEVEKLQRELAAKQAQLEAEMAAHAEPAADISGRLESPPAPQHPSAGFAAGLVLAAACVGFWLGYVTLARRVRRKFGGLKVY